MSPLIAARSGRITGNGRKLRSSRASRGNRPARRNEDLPAPDAPRMTRSRGGVFSRKPRRPVERLDDRCVAAEEDAGVLGFERSQAAIGRPVRIVGGGQAK